MQFARLGTILGSGVLLSLAIAASARAGTLTQIYSFQGKADGGNPEATLVPFGTLLYGTTTQLVSSTNPFNGSVYSLDPATNKIRVVYTFKGGSNGAGPVGGITVLSGKLYGTTSGGGLTGNTDPYGAGTLYSVDPATGAQHVLYRFRGGRDGYYPTGTMLAAGGLLYGTTQAGGGATACGGGGCGTIFSFDPATGVEKTLYAFQGGGDGSGPVAGLIAMKGVLYGTAETGGGGTGCSFIPTPGCGTVYAFDPVRGTEKTLYAFQGGAQDGAYPVAKLLAVGNVLYGTTANGGKSACPDCQPSGTVFSVDPLTRAEHILHFFSSYGSDGAHPQSELVAAHGAYYGTTFDIGQYGYGTIYSIGLASGAEKTLYQFNTNANLTHGFWPIAGLTVVGNALFGSTSAGGVEMAAPCGYNCGTLFTFKP